MKLSVDSEQSGDGSGKALAQQGVSACLCVAAARFKGVVATATACCIPLKSAVGDEELLCFPLRMLVPCD